MSSSRKLPLLVSSLLAALLLSTTATAPLALAGEDASTVSPAADLKIHPFLLYGAQVEPNRVVRVIVQMTSNDAKVDQLAARVPGLTVVEQIKIIPVLVASIPQGAISTLAGLTDVRYVSPDGPVNVVPNAKGLRSPREKGADHGHEHPKRHIDASHLLTTYPIDTGAAQVWADNTKPSDGVAVALIDSGIDATHADLQGQVVAVNVNKSATTAGDGYGHGTHVAGIINGHDAAGHYLGISPTTNLISVKVADDSGQAFESDLLRGLDWVEQNGDAYKIRVLNLSVSTSLPASYATSPIDAAVERLWHDGVTVVAAAGNLGSAEDAVWYAPANDPLVITVGCLDENQTTSASDDSLCPISSRGITEDGFAKPDLIAPGRKIVSALAGGLNHEMVGLAREYPERLTADGKHIRLSGTSMSAPMVSGAAALLLLRHHDLTPGQIKQLLVGSARSYPEQADRAGALDIMAALNASDHPPAKTPAVAVPVNGTTPPGGASTVVWDGARWTAAYWDGARWTAAYWDGARWTAAHWDGARWTAAYWDGARWTSAYWDGARWTAAYWDGARWTGAISDSARRFD